MIIDNSTIVFTHQGCPWSMFVVKHSKSNFKPYPAVIYFRRSPDALIYKLHRADNEQLFKAILKRRNLSKAEELELGLLDRQLIFVVRSFLSSRLDVV